MPFEHKNCFLQLVNAGKSVIVCEHHEAVMAHATGSSTSAHARRDWDKPRRACDHHGHITFR
jgi:hypothetical protein